MNALLFWLLLMLVFMVAYALGAQSTALRARAERNQLEQAAPRVAPETLAALQSRLAPMLGITGHKTVGNTVQFTGHLKGQSEEMFRRIREAFAHDPVTPMLLEGEENDVRVVLLPRQQTEPESKPDNWALHWGLFFATIATTTWAGALDAGVNLLTHPERFAVGLPYSLGLLLILGSHELGHYFTAKFHHIRVTPPYFIPVPFALGTFGAFIKIKSLTPDRRALFDVAVAGPLAGLVFAIPALLIGLRFSEVIPGGADFGPGLREGGVNVGSSILLAFLANISLGAPVIPGAHLVLHPLAFAGWLGLIVTALNLLPIGQLDGGHISHALFGSRAARAISVVGMFSLFLLALFVWPGLMFWAFIVFFIAGVRDAPAANDLTPVGPRRVLLGLFSFLLLLLIIVPVPESLFEAIGIHSPYL
jgi:membrane-associated protease RseP (regulator of RpoE activity)